jgi:hypothetical protein
MDLFFSQEQKLVLASAIIPLLFQLVHAIGIIDFSPLGFLFQGGRQNFLFLSIVFICAGFPFPQVVGVLAAGTFVALTVGASPSQPLVINILSFAGMFTLPVLIFHLYRGERKMTISTLVGWLPFLFTTITAPAALSLGSKIFSSWTFDGVLLVMEKNMLGGQTAFQRFLSAEHIHRWIGWWMRFIYDDLNLAAASIVGFAIRYKYKRVCIPLFFIFSGLIAGSIYGLVPVVGPLVTLQHFGDKVPFGRLEVLENFPKNGMPSLHVGWALSIAIFSYEMRKPFLNVIYTLFFIFTALSTMAIGEHYLIDLIVGIPFILCILSFMRTSSTSIWKNETFKIYFLIVLLWYVGILLNLVPRIPVLLLWSLFGVSTVICTVIETREQRRGSKQCVLIDAHEP